MSTTVETLSLERKIKMHEAREAIINRLAPTLQSQIDLDKFLQAIVSELGQMMDVERCDVIQLAGTGPGGRALTSTATDKITVSAAAMKPGLPSGPGTRSVLMGKGSGTSSTPSTSCRPCPRRRARSRSTTSSPVSASSM